MSDFKAIILAGGSGERFWPLSTPEKPKQFLNVFGGDSLIRQSVRRLRGLVKPQDVFVITSKALVAATRRELPEIPRANIVGEPMRRDTGAAVALGVGLAMLGSDRVGVGSDRVGVGSDRVARRASCATLRDPKAYATLRDPKACATLRDPKAYATLRDANDSRDSGDTVLGFFPSDQLATDPVRFRKTIAAAVAKAKESDSVVTVGIRPDYPATQFGYVDPKTGRFVEKPDARKAKLYLKRGYLWNAGMFIGRAETFKRAFAKHAPELLPLLTSRVSRPASLKSVYESLPRISFDFAVMEKLHDVKVVKGDFGWDDVGSYGAFDRYFPHDSHGNVREGPCTAVEADGNICVARSARISLLGVKNLVVVTTPDYVLVADKSRITEMKKLFGK